MKNYLVFILVTLVFTSCSTVKKNGYYQTRNYSFGKHKIGRTDQRKSYKRSNGKAESTPLELSYDGDKNRVSGVQEDAVQGDQIMQRDKSVRVREFGTSNLKARSDSSSDTTQCDNIILTDGSEIKGKVTEIGLDAIRYKRCDHLDGPVIVLRRSKVFMVEYSNGQRDIFGVSQGEYDQPPKGKNRELIALGIFLMLLGAGIVFVLSILVGAVLGGLGFIMLLVGVSN